MTLKGVVARGDSIELTFQKREPIKLDIARLIVDERIKDTQTLEDRMEKLLTPQLDEGWRIQVAVTSVSPLNYAVRPYQYAPTRGRYDPETKKVVVTPVPEPSKADLYGD